MRARILIVVALWLLAAAAGIVAGCAPASEEPQTSIILATSIDIANAGWFKKVRQEFEKRYGVRVKVVASAPEEALAVARRGDADAVLLTEPETEKLVKEGVGVGQKEVARKGKDVYAVVAVSRRKFPRVKFEEAKRFIDWITSREARDLIKEAK